VDTGRRVLTPLFLTSARPSERLKEAAMTARDEIGMDSVDHGAQHVGHDGTMLSELSN
jgi:hypothetical protein